MENELKQRLDEVERLNKLMVGRELKMEQFRKEIARLRDRVRELEER
jgi:predicted  nucleic acid-binding Zn-ribbon protein